MVSEESVLREIRRVVERELATTRDVRPSDRLIADLGLDSLTLTTLAVELEDRFHVALSDEAAARLETAGALARCVVLRAALGPTDDANREPREGVIP
jgi:acyl carrier protein